MFKPVAYWLVIQKIVSNLQIRISSRGRYTGGGRAFLFPKSLHFGVDESQSYWLRSTALFPIRFENFEKDSFRSSPNPCGEGRDHLKRALRCDDKLY